MVEQGRVLNAPEVVLHERGLELAASVARGEVMLICAHANQWAPLLCSQLARR